MGIDLTEALSHAELPADLFDRNDVSLSTDEYFRLWNGIDRATGDKEVALLIAQYITAESFDAPVFSALCCQNLNAAILRISDYKPLIGPLQLFVKKGSFETCLKIESIVKNQKIPYALCMIEAVFFTKLARIGTRENISPTSVILLELPKSIEPYEDYFGSKITQGPNLCISFQAEDASKSFLTSSGSMWDFFEEKLNKKLADVTGNAKISERVKTTLLEALPSGDSSIDFVARKLAISKRTLQRKLASEAESFQSILLCVREQLAQHYLRNSDMSLSEISYLLGFKEPNSFIRAFNDWEGVSPTFYRSQLEHC